MREIPTQAPESTPTVPRKIRATASLKTRILGAFILAFVLLLGADGYSLLQLRALGEGLSILEGGYLPLARQTAKLESIQSRIDQDADRLVQRSPAAFRSNLALHHRAFDQTIAEAASTAETLLPLASNTENHMALGAIRLQLERVRELSTAYTEAGEAWVLAESLVGSPPTETATHDEQAARAALSKQRIALATAVKQLSSQLEGAILRVSERTAQTQARANTVGGALAAGAFLGGLAMLAWTLITLRPISHLTEGVRIVAQGDFSRRVTISSNDELGLLADAFNHMAESLAERDVRLERDQERLRRSERLALVGQMLAQICHEVRNPLNAMNLNAELLSEEIDALERSEDNEASEILSRIHREIGRLEKVTEHYLDMSRPAHAATVADDIGLLVRSVCQLEVEAFKRDHVALDVTTENLPAIPLDEAQMRRALLNVLRNARESGANNVSVDVRAQEQEEGTVAIVVRDDGPGMDEEMIQRAFDPFVTTRAKGTGLGLAITRQVLEAHGGRVECHSSPGEGCEIVLVVPTRNVEAPGLTS
jgi:signal transduction histidine kinase